MSNTPPEKADNRVAYLLFFGFTCAAAFFARQGVDDKSMFTGLVITALCAIVIPLLVAK